VNFPFNVFLAAFASAWITTIAALPLWRRWCLRTGLVDDPGHRKIHDSPIPLAGGFAVLTGILLPLLIAGLALSFLPFAQTKFGALSYGFDKRAWQLAAIGGGAIGMTLLGWLDDRHELKAGPKFAGQLAIAALVAWSGVRITLFVPNELFSYAITILWILTLVNAFNFMDNMNGLCAGLGIIGAWLFAISAATAGQYLVALIALLTAGALLGFLPYNFPNARAFLGDAGSHLVGFLLAVLAILPHFYTPESPRRFAVVTPLLVLAVPLGDLAWVVLLRTRLRQPFWIGDTNHLSHRLVRAGLSKRKAVLVIWALAAAIGSIALIW